MNVRMLILTALLTLLLLPLAQAQPDEQPFVASSPSTANINAMAMDDDRIYFGHSGGRIVAADRADGRIVWHRSEYVSPVRDIFGLDIDDQDVFVGHRFRAPNQDFSDGVASYDKATGARNWVRTYSRPECTPEATAQPCARDGLRLLAEQEGDDKWLYIGFDRGLVAKVDARRIDPAQPGVGGGRLFLENGQLCDGCWYVNLPQVNGADTANVGAIAADSQYLWVAVNDNLGSSTEDPNNRIHKIDKQTGQLVGSGYALNGAAQMQFVINGLHADDNALFAAMFGGRVLRMSPEPNAAGDFPVQRLVMVTDLNPANPTPRTPVGIVGDGANLYTSHLGGFLYRWTKDTMDPVYVNDDGRAAPKHPVQANSRAAALAPDGAWIAQGYDDGRFSKTTTAQGPAVAVLTPNGGQALDGKPTHPMRWSMNDHHSTDGLEENPYIVDVRFQLSSDAGATWQPPFLSIAERAFTFSNVNQQNLLDTTQLPEGDQYKLKVTVSDPDGFSATDVSDGVFTIDRTPPTGAPVYPAPGATIRDTCPDDCPRFSVLLADNLAGVDASSVRFLVDGQLQTINNCPDGPCLRALPGSASYTWSANRFPLSQGIHTVRVTFQDMAGNPAAVEWSFQYDTRPPEPPVTVPARNAFTADSAPDLELRYQEAVHVVSATFGPKGGAAVDVTGDIRVGVGQTVMQYQASTLEAGRGYVLTLTVADAVGNVATTALPFGVDTVKPQLTVGAQGTPGDGAVTGSSTAGLVVVATDDFAGIEPTSMRWRINGDDRSGQATIVGDRLNLLLRNLASGSYTSTVEASDRAGNTATLSWTFRVDTNSPIMDVELVLPGSQKAVKTGDPITIVARATDQDKIDRLEVDLGGLSATRGWTAMPVVENTGSMWEGRTTATVTETANRVLRVQVKAVDKLGNTALQSFDVTVDNVAPTSQMGKLDAFLPRAFSLTWTGSDAYGQVGHYDLEMSVDGGPFQPLATGITGTGHEFSTPLDVAKLRFRVFATDTAGNRQPVAAPPVSTSVVGSVFESVIAPARIVPGTSALLAAELVTRVDYPIDDVQVQIRKVGSNETRTVSLDRMGGHTFATQTEGLGLTQGRYVMVFVARGSDGLTTFESAPQFVEVQTDQRLDQTGDKKDSPLPAAVVLGALALALARRRR